MPVHVVPGSHRHGVNEQALAIAAATGAEVVHAADAAAAELALNRMPGRAAHLHVTDQLWGAGAAVAADRLVALAAGRRLTVTLHDLPQASDGEHQDARESAYAAISEAADGVVVCSEHEKQLLRATGSTASPTVIPLAIDQLPLPDRRPAGDRQVTISGFVYPGKGHSEAIDALAGLPEEVGLVALGQASDGCEWLVDELRAKAEACGRQFVISGYIDSSEWNARLRTAGVPLAAHAHISASGTIGSWIAAGRRPLVAASPYAAEIADRAPSALVCYQPDRLSDAIREALEDPASTWHDGMLDLPTTADVAARYVEWWAGR